MSALWHDLKVGYWRSADANQAGVLNAVRSWRTMRILHKVLRPRAGIALDILQTFWIAARGEEGQA